MHACTSNPDSRVSSLRPAQAWGRGRHIRLVSHLCSCPIDNSIAFHDERLQDMHRTVVHYQRRMVRAWDAASAVQDIDSTPNTGELLSTTPTKASADDFKNFATFEATPQIDPSMVHECKQARTEPQKQGSEHTLANQPRGVTVVLASGEEWRCTWALRASSTAAGSWSGTSLQASFTDAFAGTMVLMPSPAQPHSSRVRPGRSDASCMHKDCTGEWVTNTVVLP